MENENHEHGDNLKIQVNGVKKNTLRLALEIALLQWNKITSYKVTKKHGLILYWAHPDDTDANEFPFKAGLDELVPFVWAWLNEIDYLDFRYPDAIKNLDHDGSNVCGFEVYNEKWNRIGEEHEALIAIRPAYIWMGK